MNEKHLLRELISGIGSTTSYPTYLFDGNELIDLNSVFEIYNKKLKLGKLHFLGDNTKNNAELKKFGLKEHYSNNAGKIWYYINEDGDFKYRIEIRTKGNCYNSLQFQLHKLHVD